MHAPNRATIVKGRGKNGLKQAKLLTNSVTTLQLCVLLLHNCPRCCCFVELWCDEVSNVTRLMKGQAQVIEAFNLLQRLVRACENGLCVITNDPIPCYRTELVFRNANIRGILRRISPYLTSSLPLRRLTAATRCCDAPDGCSLSRLLISQHAHLYHVCAPSATEFANESLDARIVERSG